MDAADAEGKVNRDLFSPDCLPSRPDSVSCQSCSGPGRPLSQASVTTGLRTSSVTPNGFNSESRCVTRPATCETHMVEDFYDNELSLSPQPKSGRGERKPWSARAHPLKIAFSSHPSHLEKQLPVRTDAGFGVGFGPRKPPSCSPHDSALRTAKEGWPQAEIPQTALIQTALENDKKRLEYKYKNVMTSRFQPLPMDSARYHVKLPSSPQHRKYVAGAPVNMLFTSEQREKGAARKTLKKGNTQVFSQQISDGRPKTRQRVAYNIKRLEGWFKLMDTNSSGEITVRKLIVGMMKHQELCDLFYLLKDSGSQDMWAVNPHDRPKVGSLTKDDMDWIREVLTNLDQDGNSSMDWPEFVDFFRKAGLLLEYSTRDDLNQSHLGETNIELHRQKMEEERKDQQNKFFNEARRGAQAAGGEKNKDTLAKKRMSLAPKAAASARQSDCSQAQTT